MVNPRVCSRPGFPVLISIAENLDTFELASVLGAVAKHLLSRHLHTIL